jgi:hypothetical protein
MSQRIKTARDADEVDSAGGKHYCTGRSDGVADDPAER